MGLFSWLSGSNSAPDWSGVDWSRVVIDLTEFRCGRSALGQPPDFRDFFHGDLERRDTARSEADGLELGTQDGQLDWIFVTLDAFTGRFAAAGRPLPLSRKTREEEIVAVFGPPYWRDEDEDNLLLLYEEKTFELQFEFPQKAGLAHITLLRSPLMANPEQRRAYGVTAPWPPEP